MERYGVNVEGTNKKIPHRIVVEDRKFVEISGVKQVDSFDQLEFLLDTNMGYMVIRGNNLQMNNLDLERGIVSIKGRIDEMIYVDEEQKKKSGNLWSKLFR
ncbi:MAG: sporulation protein YabP [Bacilli bacterium]